MKKVFSKAQQFWVYIVSSQYVMLAHGYVIYSSGYQFWTFGDHSPAQFGGLNTWFNSAGNYQVFSSLFETNVCELVWKTAAYSHFFWPEEFFFWTRLKSFLTNLQYINGWKDHMKALQMFWKGKGKASKK